MGRKYGKKRPVVVTLPAQTELTCGCDPRHEPGFRDYNIHFEFGYTPEQFGPRVMLKYHDGTMRHKRCGRISEPVPTLERFFNVLGGVLKRIDEERR